MRSLKCGRNTARVWLMFLFFFSTSYAQHYGNKFIIAPNYNFNQFSVDRIAQQIYADLYGGRVYRIDLRTMAVDTTRFTGIAPYFGNKKHLMLWRDTLFNMDEGSFYKLPLPDSPVFAGSLTYSFPILFSPNDSNLMLSINSLEIPYLVNGYIFSLTDSSLAQIDTSVNFFSTLPPQWSSDTTLVYGINDSSLVEYYIGSKRIDTLITLHNYSRITDFACNSKENILAYGASIWIAPNFSERIYFHYGDSLSDSLVFSLTRNDPACNSLADELTSLSWSPNNDRLGFLAFSNINSMTSIYFYLLDSNRTYRATQCNDPDVKYALEWVNEDTLIYFDATDGHLYGMDVTPVIDAIHAKKNDPLPADFSLSSYPNPFNPTTKLSVTLPGRENAILSIYDVLGKLVKEYKIRNDGGTHYDILWDATNGNNERVASGLYLGVLRLDDPQNQNRKITKIIYLK